MFTEKKKVYYTEKKKIKYFIGTGTRKPTLESLILWKCKYFVH